MSDIKKLCLYCLDCIKSSGKNTAFNNLKGNKDNKITITDAEQFKADNKEIIDIMTLQALNKSTMQIFKGYLIAEGTIKNQKYCTPLLYMPAELERNGDKINLICDDDFEINYSFISSLLDNDVEKVEIIVNQLQQIEEPEKIDFTAVLKGLIPDINKLSIKNKQAVILAKNPENIAGLINELKMISEEY